MEQRLNKLIAQSGFCSRRKADELILKKRVKLNAKTVTALGVIADPEKDQILIDGQPLKQERKIYILLHKPKGYTTTTKDVHAKKMVLELLPELPFRLYPVGRLDRQTCGLLICTNDGSLSYTLTHPKFEVDRVYRVLVKNLLTNATIKKIERGGLSIDDYQSSPCKIKLLFWAKDKTKLEITIHEGKKRQLRKMFLKVGHPVIDLKRVRFGKLQLGDLKPGQWRYLKKSEIL